MKKIIMVIALVAVFALSACAGEENAKVKPSANAVQPPNTETSANAGSDTETDTETASEPVELTPKEQMIVKLSDLIESSKQAFDTGNYIKGDIPPGEYAFVSFDGSGQYYSEKDPSGNIIDNENFDSFGYVHVHGVGNTETQGVLISPGAFRELGVSNAKMIYEVLNETNDYKDSGWYKVGTDILAGSYVVESYGEGYVAVHTGPVGKGEIVDNENFSGKYAVSVIDGQYLQVSNGFLTKQP
jgi:hypothetical protein